MANQSNKVSKLNTDKKPNFNSNNTNDKHKNNIIPFESRTSNQNLAPAHQNIDESLSFRSYSSIESNQSAEIKKPAIIPELLSDTSQSGPYGFARRHSLLNGINCINFSILFCLVMSDLL